MTSESEILELLSQVLDPESGRDFRASGQIDSVAVDGDSIHLDLRLSSWSSPLKPELENQIRQRLQSQWPSIRDVEVRWRPLSRKPLVANTIGLECKSVIAVAAGKGGVGKSTVATCLALALKRLGSTVGLLDADVYGPSIPQLTGVRGYPTEADGKLVPLDYDGIPVVSIGFLVPPDQAVIWRGPMLHSAVTKFLRDTAWGALDYLVIDMPPGTGDVALTLSQLMPISGAVIVCTPQRVALLDAIKAVGMFQKVKIPVIGVVENMNTFICPDNGRRYDIFGHGGAKQYASEAGLNFLGEVPINIQLRERGDSGTSDANFDDPNVAPFLTAIAQNLTRTLAEGNAKNPPKRALPVLG